MASRPLVDLTTPLRSMGLYESSPLSSVSELCKPKRPTLKQGSKAQAIPEGVQTGFSSAATLFLDTRLEKQENIGQASSRPDKPKRHTQKVRKGNNERPKDCSLQKNDTGGKNGEVRPVKRRKKEVDEDQMTIRGNASKPGIRSRARRPRFMLPSLSPSETTNVSLRKAPEEEQFCESHEATRQHKPIENRQDADIRGLVSDDPEVMKVISITKDMDESHTKLAAENALTNPFQDLHGYFGFNNQSSIRPPVSICSRIPKEPLSKQPRISPTKAKKPLPKSLRTVTNIALAQFQPVIEETEPFGPITESFTKSTESSRDQKSSRPEEDTAKKNKVPRKIKSKARQNLKKSPLTQALLPPEDAVRRFEQQDIFFGTSSQLASEESVAYITEVQRALKESESAHGEAIGKPLNGGTADESNLNTSGGHKLIVTTRGLWQYASRDLENGLLESTPRSPKQAAMGQVQALAAYEDFDDIDQVNLSETEIAAESEVKALKLVSTIADTSRPSLVCMSQIRNYSTAPKSRQNQNGVASVTIKDSKTVQKSANKSASERQDVSPQEKTDPTTKRPRGRPRKSTPSTNRTKSPKPKRSRKPSDKEARSAQCITGKVPDKMTEINEGSTPQLPSKWHDIDEIEDSEPEPTSSPLRRSSQETPQLELSPIKSNAASSNQNSKALKATSSKLKRTRKTNKHDEALAGDIQYKDLVSDVFPLISKAIKTAPRGTTSSPSWYEKILLYDPIVLEDLTTWLNDGQLIRVGRDEDAPPIWPSTVQKWCEANSICCLWKESLWGNRRKAF